ncbi:MAG: metallophosphoesterase [Opitutaceae bacterium]|nr:metallophosphoesterase [Opitutaceae bacterium]
MNSSSLKCIAGAVALLVLAGVPVAQAEAFSFGVMGDTQWSGSDPTGNNVNTVAVNQIKAVNTQFVAAGVDFVVQVGDLCDSNGSNNAALQTRLAANSGLNSAGIAFYGLRGNHESGSGSKTYFQQNYIPASTAAATVAIAPDGASYSVNHNGTKVVLLDISLAGSTSLQPAATTWMGSQLSAADHTQGFVFTHKNLLGQNHKDSYFGGSNDANPDLQNAFFAAAAGNGVKYVISGHDHMDYRSQVTSPNGLASVQQIITASDSYKYYDPQGPYSPRETPISGELDQTGYYIYTVDGPRVTGKYYGVTPLANGDVPANPDWKLKEVFGYSLNGAAKLVARGASYAMTHSMTAGTSYGESGYVGTTMAILAGTNASAATTADGRATSKDVNVGWAPAAHGPAGAESDVLTLWGMSDLSPTGATVDKTDSYALSLTFAADQIAPAALAAGDVGIAGRDASGNWFNATTLNYGGNTEFVFGAWNSSYPLGTYGIDLSSAGGPTAWAVLNYAGEFAVTSLTAIPEPSTYAALFGAAALSFVGFRRQRRRAA